MIYRPTPCAKLSEHKTGAGNLSGRQWRDVAMYRDNCVMKYVYTSDARSLRCRVFFRQRTTCWRHRLVPPIAWRHWILRTMGIHDQWRRQDLVRGGGANLGLSESKDLRVAHKIHRCRRRDGKEIRPLPMPPRPFSKNQGNIYRANIM